MTEANDARNLTASAPSWRRNLGVLRHRGYRRFVFARTSSVLGSAMAPIALAFAVLRVPHASAADLGLILMSRAIAQVGLVVMGGVIADRFSRYRVMVCSDLTAGATEMAVAMLFLTGHFSLGAMMALSACNGAASAMFMPAAAGLVPQLVGPSELQPANALARLTTNGAGVAGAAFAGVIASLVHPAWAVAADAASYFLSASLLIGLALPPRTRSQPTTVIDDLRHGWREFTIRPWVWIIVVQFALSNACFSAGLNVLGPIVSKARYHGAAGFAAMRVAQATGLVVGSIVAMRVRPKRPLRAATFVTLAFAPPLLLMALRAPLWTIVAVMFIDGVAADVFEVLWSTSLHTHVPEAALSRVSAYDVMGSFALVPIATAAIGPVADIAGITETLVIGSFVITAATLCALSSRSVRMLPSEAPASTIRCREASPGTPPTSCEPDACR